MIAAKDAIASAISGLPGVWGVDIGLKEDGEGGITDEIVIRILVEDLANVHPFIHSAIATSLFPVVIIERHFVPIDDTQRHRPLIGGISIAAEHDGAVTNSGTLGGFARTTPGLLASFPGVFSSNDLLGISAAHVIAKDGSGAQLGDKIHQPHIAALGSRQVGTLLWWSDRLDAAVFRLLPTEPALQQIKPATPTNGRAQHAFDQKVWKRGVTTGLTHGRVISAEPTFFSSSLAGMFQIFRDLNEPVFCDHGDSGSLVLNEFNQVVGLLVKADVPGTIGTIEGFTAGWMVPIAPICQELLVEF
ncbi:MAG: serine protease [Rhodospirillales bacterium]|nr:serine protease [Rhodospirillales bacterium]